MGAMESFRHDQRERLSHSFRARIAKGSLGCLVPMDDIALPVGGNDGVVSGLRHRSESFFARAQRELGPFPSEDLSQMIAQLVDGVEEGGIRIANFRREEFENSEQVRPVSNGKAERCFESMLGSEPSAGEIAILGYIHDPSGRILLPDPARKPGTPLELHFEARLPESCARQFGMK